MDFTGSNGFKVRKVLQVLFILGLTIGLFTLLTNTFVTPGHALQDRVFIIIGELMDGLGQPVEGATISVVKNPSGRLLGETESCKDGSWTLPLEDVPAQDLEVHVERPHFLSQAVSLNPSDLEALTEAGLYHVEVIELERKIDSSLWIAGLIFEGVLLLIAFEYLHSATSALASISLILLISYGGGAYYPNLTIFTLEQAIEYIDWEVIFLLIGMMIIIAIIEETGIFQWMAFQAYRLSRGRSWLLVIILMAITVIASALLDNFTTMWLMVPIGLQIGMVVGINPLALIIPEVLASNVGGITTLVGTPTNIRIGAYAGIGFNDFLVKQTLGVIVALFVMGGYVLYHYREEWKKHVGGISENLYKKLKENTRIENKNDLWKLLLVFMLVFVGFILGEQVHLVPAVSALAGATILLIWLNPDIHKMIKAVDWTTLVFFMALFMIVGAVQEVGLIGFIASWMSRIVGDNLVLGIFLIIFGVGTLSTMIANIPLTASILPIVRILTNSVPGAGSLVLFYALSLGAAMDGNGFLIGDEANLITAGITEQTNYPISFKEFLKVGLPVTYLTLTVGFLWLLIHF